MARAASRKNGGDRTGSGIRTHTSFRTTDFESAASTVPPSRHAADSMVRLGMTRRIERKIFRINDEIERLLGEEKLVFEELQYHRHIADDARRDAAVGNADDRAFARETERDVPRFERALSDLRRRRSDLEEERTRLLNRLGEL